MLRKILIVVFIIGSIGAGYYGVDTLLYVTKATETLEQTLQLLLFYGGTCLLGGVMVYGLYRKRQWVVPVYWGLLTVWASVIGIGIVSHALLSPTLLAWDSMGAVFFWNAIISLICPIPVGVLIMKMRRRWLEN